MTSANDLIKIINKFSLSKRLEIIEEVLKKIREESTTTELHKASNPKGGILSFAGILDEKEAQIFEGAIQESRKIDQNEW